MGSWTQDELARFATLDDFHVSPFRDDRATYGTPTFIWSVVTRGGLYIRPYFGASSRWYRAALDQGAGRIRLGGVDHEVRFAPADPSVLDAVDAAYRAKYAASPYLSPMVAAGPRSATVEVTPRRPPRAVTSETPA